MQDVRAETGERLLLSCFACDPTRGSECYVGWNWVTAVYAGFPITVLTRRYHRDVLEKQAVPNTEFVYFDLPFCGGLSHHHKLIKLYYVLWQVAVLPFALTLAVRRRITMVHHITYNVLDFPGLLWMIPRTRFIWGPVGGGQVPPASLKVYYGRNWRQQVCRAFLKRSAWFNPLGRLALLRASLVFAANTDTFRILHALIPDRSRLHKVLETAISEVGEPRAPGTGPVGIVWVGRFEARKAPVLAIEIFERLQQIAPGRFTLRIIGEGEMWQAARARAARLPGAQVSLPVAFAQMQSIYRASDILLFTSLQDTSGNVVLESMAQGIPVVALDHQGAADMLAEGGGRLVRPGTPQQVIEGFCQALLELAEPAAYAAASRAAVVNITRNYLWSAKRRQVLDLLARLAVIPAHTEPAAKIAACN